MTKMNKKKSTRAGARSTPRPTRASGRGRNKRGRPASQPNGKHPAPIACSSPPVPPPPPEVHIPANVRRTYRCLACGLKTKGAYPGPMCPNPDCRRSGTTVREDA